MTRFALLAGLLLLLACPGCLRTYHVEHAQYVDSRLNSDGTASAESHTEAAGRAWQGLWPFAPGNVRP